jgi:hypothetical protein
VARFQRDGSQVRLLPRGLMGWKLSPAEHAALNREAPGSIPGHPIAFTWKSEPTAGDGSGLENRRAR